MDTDQTAAFKSTFEAVADSYGVKVLRYLADYGVFAECGFKGAVNAANQLIQFCAIFAHNQNVIVERKLVYELTILGPY